MVRTYPTYVAVSYIKTHNHALKLENVIFQPVPRKVKEQAEKLLLLGVPATKVNKNACFGGEEGENLMSMLNLHKRVLFYVLFLLILIYCLQFLFKKVE